jgi:cytochrome b subunit of formate dehydrogenase
METASHEETWVERFAAVDRITHATLFTTFLGLSLTGLPLLFADAPWARTMAALLGGYGVTGTLHRVFGFAMLFCFAFHVGRVVFRLYRKRGPTMLWGPDSLVPQPRDLFQMYDHFMYFLGRGPRPQFDRYTYWEKFDYWAVFWGMGIIGTSGLVLAFPEFVSRFLPGDVFTIALLVHGEEALLAMVFIFTIHFFNGNLRPEKFPMDTVMFTGRIPLHELRDERPAEYDRLVREGRLEHAFVPPPQRRLDLFGRLVGTVAISLGLIMVALTAIALLS